MTGAVTTGVSTGRYQRQYTILKPEDTSKARENVFNNAKDVQYNVGKDIAADASRVEENYSTMKECGAYVSIGTFVISVLGIAGAAFTGGASLIPVIASVGGVCTAGSLGVTGYAAYKENEANNEKNDAIAYANIASSDRNDPLQGADEGHIAKDLDKALIAEKLDEMIKNGALTSDEITYLALTSSSDLNSKEITLSQFDVNLLDYNSKHRIDGGENDYYGIEQEEITMAKEFQPFFEKLMYGYEELNENTVGSLTDIAKDVSEGDFKYFDLNGDGHINDCDKRIMSMYINDEKKIDPKGMSIQQQTDHDLNGDGKCDEADDKMYQTFLGKMAGTGVDDKALKEKMDINKDGKYDTKDIKLMDEYLGGLLNYATNILKTANHLEETIYGNLENATINGVTKDALSENAKH